MKRLLFVGLEVANFPSVNWQDWKTANPLDYQGLLLDCREPQTLAVQSSVAVVLQAMVANGHTIYVFLPEERSIESAPGPLQLIPAYYLYLERAAGQTLRVSSGDPFFANYLGALAGHEICFRVQQASNQSPWPLATGIVDNVSRPICGKMASIYLLHPPARKLEQKALKTIIEHFAPDPVPVSTAPRPSWVDEIATAIPGVNELQALRASISSEILERTAQLEIQEETLRNLSSWADLLCLEGLALQAKVNEALNFLGIASVSTDPTGHTGDLEADESGTHFVFEVTGSSGTIGIEKGRQLMQWVADTPDPANSKGVLIANAFRNHPPDQRPPSSDKRIFVLEVERLATKYHLALLDSRELYRAVCAKLAGTKMDKATVLNSLLGDGIVRFPI